MTLEAAETQRTMDELEAQIYARVMAGEDGTELNDRYVALMARQFDLCRIVARLECNARFVNALAGRHDTAVAALVA